jgi:hypothetical protein
MDHAGVTCDQSALTDVYDGLEAVIDGIPAAFVYNVDETGGSEWADKLAEMIVLVSTNFEKDKIPVPVDRHSKRPMMVGRIARDGNAMKAMMIVN